MSYTGVEEMFMHEELTKCWDCSAEYFPRHKMDSLVYCPTCMSKRQKKINITKTIEEVAKKYGSNDEQFRLWLRK